MLKELLKANGLTESDLKPKDTLSSIEAKLDMLIKYQELMLKQIDEHQYEVVKEAPSSGDYTNPIHLDSNGLNTVVGKWYYTSDKDLPHEAIVEAFVTNEDFDNKSFFDFV